jgi:hypothetical protein
MARIELTISADYLPNWKLMEGLRELIQNAKDAEVQHDAKMTIDYRNRRVDGYDTGGLIITNDGCTMPLEALLLGHTTKLGDSRTIGQYGEGLKLAAVALIRNGYKLKIRNGSEVWEPKIEKSATFDSNVLVFDIHKGRKFENRVQFEVLGVNDQEWEDIRSKILFLSDKPLAKISNEDGQLLLDSEYAGKIFLKGMFVAKCDHKYGFNFYEGDIDRDRRMLNDVTYKIQTFCASLMNSEANRKIIGSWYFEQISQGSFNYGYLHNEAVEFIAEKFKKSFGDVIPVESEEEEKELAHLGSRGRVTNRYLRNILERKFGTASDLIRKLRLNAEKTYALEDLEQEERDNFNFCLQLVQRAYYATGEVSDLNVSIVDFADSKTLGTYADGLIRIARKLLLHKSKLIVTLAHEAAHKYGDNSESFHRAEELIIESVIDNLLNSH